MLHHPFLHTPVLSKNDLSELYVAGSLRSFAIGLVGIFIPIFLFRQGWEISEIFVFYMVFLTYSLLIAPLLGGYATRYGAKHLMALSFAFSFVSLAFLSLSESHLIVHGVVAPAYAIAETAYWISIHLILTEAKEGGHVGKAVAKFNIFAGVAAAVGPLIGGYVGQYYGLKAVFITCLFLLLIALWPLFETRERLIGNYFDIARLKKDKNIISDMIIFGFGTVPNMSMLIIWPLLIYAKTGGLIKTGAIVAASLVVTTLAAWQAGKLNDDHKGRKVRKIGAILVMVSPIILVLAPNLFVITAASMIGYVGQMFCVVPRFASMVKRAVKTSPIEYITVTFLSSHIAKFIYILTIVTIASSGVDGLILLEFAVIFAGVFGLMCLKNLDNLRR